MIIRAPRPDRGFTILSNDVLRDARLSYRARGLLAAILSRPDNWRTDATQLARESQEGREAVLTALRELRTVGYMTQRKVRGPKGRIATVTTVYDQPQNADVLAGQTGNGFPEPGPPDAGSPDALRSTETENRDEDEVLVHQLASSRDGERTSTYTDWRTEDRDLFREHIDCTHVTRDGKAWPIESLYNGLVKPKAQGGWGIDWPGRYLAHLADTNGVHHWLAASAGMEPLWD